MYKDIKLNDSGDMSVIFGISDKRADEFQEKMVSFCTAYTGEIEKRWADRDANKWPIDDFVRRFLDSCDVKTDAEYAYVCTFISSMIDGVKALILMSR